MDIWDELYKKALAVQNYSKDIEILMDYDTKKTITLGELIPDWWGTAEFDKL